MSSTLPKFYYGTEEEPKVLLNNGYQIPSLAFGLYKIPPTEECDVIVLQAIHAGYRHFDTASYYGNEAALGRALKKSGVPRNDFFVCSKVWNDAQKEGRASVRKSLEQSLAALDFGEYLDLYLVHWPVPGYHTETYKELELLQKEGKIRSIGISNYSPKDYEELVKANISTLPAVNQFEVSPAMYRADAIKYFQDRDILVSASKALHRGELLDNESIQKLAVKYSKTPAQIMLRWGLQKGLSIVVKTATPSRMRENRSVTDFMLSKEDEQILDALTTENDVLQRDELEIQRKNAI